MARETPEQIPKLISLRSAFKAGSISGQRYRLTLWKALRLAERLRESGVPEDLILLDESAPDHEVQLHCEVMNTERFIYMRYALHAGVGMRQCFESMQHAEGLKAVSILRRYLDARSIDNLWNLLGMYQSSIVELSVYQHPLGVLKWNTLFWEVRNYSWFLVSALLLGNV